MNKKPLRLHVNIPFCTQQSPLYTGRMWPYAGGSYADGGVNPVQHKPGMAAAVSGSMPSHSVGAAIGRPSVPRTAQPSPDPSGPDGLRFYFDALRREIHAVHEDVSEYRVSSAYVGNGPLNLAPSTVWMPLLRRLRENFDMTEAELLIKLDPALLGEDDILQLSSLRRYWITMDMVSDLQEELLTAGCTREPRDMTRACLKLSNSQMRRFDLLLYYGIPNQTRESLLQSLQRAVSMGGFHISLLPFPKSPLPRDLMDLMRSAGTQFLREAGFTSYRPGRFCRERQCIRYYLDDSLEFMGIGAGAISRFDDLHFMNTDDIDLYIENADDCTVICKNL